MNINNIKFAIPLRTNIRHSYCYKFNTSDRETDSITGIDYSKAVVISKDSYLGEVTDINDKEYLELQQKTFFIINKFKKYVLDAIVRNVSTLKTADDAGFSGIFGLPRGRSFAFAGIAAGRWITEPSITHR